MRVERIQPELYSGSENNVFRVKNDSVRQQMVGQDAQTAEEQPEEKITEEKLNKKVEQLNSALEFFNRKFHFQVHEQTKRIIVQVLNSETGEIINEIPPEKFLDMLANMREAIGIVVDEKV